MYLPFSPQHSICNNVYIYIWYDVRDTTLQELKKLQEALKAKEDAEAELKRKLEEVMMHENIVKQHLLMKEEEKRQVELSFHEKMALMQQEISSEKYRLEEAKRLQVSNNII